MSDDVPVITAAGSKTPGERCECCWLGDDEHPEVSGGGTVDCACGKDHTLNLYRATAVHWEGKHWSLWCAFQEALKRLSVV